MNIGLIGKLGSGKTTAANYLASEYGYKRRSLADPMREIVKIVYPNMLGKSDPRYRPLMQKLGTDWFRSYDPDVWVNCLLARVELDIHRVVVDDVRFINEAKALRDRGWRLIYIDTSDEVRKQRCIERDGHWDESVLNHPSETEIDKAAKYAHHTINGDLEMKRFCEELSRVVTAPSNYPTWPGKCAFDE